MYPQALALVVKIQNFSYSDVNTVGNSNFVIFDIILRLEAYLVITVMLAQDVDDIIVN